MYERSGGVGHVCACGGHRLMLVSSSVASPFFLILDRVSMNVELIDWPASPRNPSLPIQCWGYRLIPLQESCLCLTHTPTLYGFNVPAGCLNSAPHDCVANTLPTAIS